MLVFSDHTRKIYLLIATGRKWNQYLTLTHGKVGVVRKPVAFSATLTQRDDLMAQHAIEVFQNSKLSKTGKAERFFESVVQTTNQQTQESFPTAIDFKEQSMKTTTQKAPISHKPAAKKAQPVQQRKPVARRKQLPLPGIEEKRSAAAKATWAKKSVAQARATHHHVRVAGAEYRSVKQAFEALGLPLEKHVVFRMQLKTSGSGRAKFEGYTFVLVPINK